MRNCVPLLALVSAALAVVGCDQPIALADGTFVDVAVPLPAVDLPSGAPPVLATIEIPGLLAETRLAIDDDNVGRARFALQVAETTEATIALRVLGDLVETGDRGATPTLFYAEDPLALQPGSEVTITRASFSDEPVVGRAWLDINRNGRSNRVDFEAGCDPGVDDTALAVSTSALQLADGERVVVVVENLLPRAVHLRAAVVDAPGVGVIDLDAAIPVPLPQTATTEVAAGGVFLVAVDYAAIDGARSTGHVVIDALDDVDDRACGGRVVREIAVVANVAGTTPAPGNVPAAAPLTSAADIGIDIDDVIVAAPDGAVHVVTATVEASAASPTVAGVPADAVFLVEIPAGQRLLATAEANAVDVDLHVFALDDGDDLGDELSRRAGLSLEAPFSGAVTEFADVAADAVTGGTGPLRVLVVAGASGATDARALAGAGIVVIDNGVPMSVRLLVTDAPRFTQGPAPTRGPAAGGTDVVFAGDGFADCAFFFDAAIADCDEVGLDLDGHLQVRCTSPAVTAVARNPVGLRAVCGTQTATLPGAFTYEGLLPVVEEGTPVVVAVSPAPLHAFFGAERFTVFGSGLESVTRAALIRGDRTYGAFIIEATDTALGVVVGEALPDGPLTLQLDAGAATVTFAVVARGMVATGITARQVVGDDRLLDVTITGTNLNPARIASVLFRPVDPASGGTFSATEFAASESSVTTTVLLGRGRWHAFVVYDNDFSLEPQVIDVDGPCPGSPLCEQCGNERLDPGEQCDSGIFGEASCVGFGYDGGALTCVGCQIDATSCAVCGNGIVDDGEACDGDDVGDATCTALGFAQGTVACDDDCRLDVTDCARCGDGACTGSETTASCASDCVASCGNGVCDGAVESCSTCPRDCDLCAPYRLIVTAGAAQSGTITRTLSQAVVVKVVDGSGVGVRGAVVTFSVARGDTVSNKIVTTDVTGEARTSWTLGFAVGAHRLDVAAIAVDGTPIFDQPTAVASTAVDVGPGTIITLVGTGALGTFIHPDGVANRSELLTVVASAVGPDGDIWLLEGNGGRLLRVRMPNGAIELVTQATNAGSTGDGGRAIDASLGVPEDVAVDDDGVVYVAERNGGAFAIRRIRLDGVIEHVAGGGAAGQIENGDDGPAATARLIDLVGMSIDSDGAVLLLQGTFNAVRLRHIDDDGIIRRVTLGQTVIIDADSLRAPAARTTLQGASSRPVQLSDDVYALGINGFGILCPPSSLSLCDDVECRCRPQLAVKPSARGPDGLLYGTQGQAVVVTDGLGGARVIAGDVVGSSGDGGDFAAASSARFGETLQRLAVTPSGDIVVVNGTRARVRLIRRGASTTPAAPPTLRITAGQNSAGPIFGAPASAPRVQLTAPTTTSTAVIDVDGRTGGEGVLAENLLTDTSNTATLQLALGRKVGAQLVDVGLAGPAGRLYPATRATVTLQAAQLGVGDTAVVNATPVAVTSIGNPTPRPSTMLELVDIGFTPGNAIAFNDDTGALAISVPRRHVVYEIDSNGRTRVVVGTAGLADPPVFGQPADRSVINTPVGVAFGADRLAVAVTANNRVGVVADAGTFDVVAGNGFNGGGTFDVPAGGATIGEPLALAILDDDLYVTAVGANGIARVDSDGLWRAVIPGVCDPTRATVDPNTLAAAALATDGDVVIAGFRAASSQSCTSLTAARTHIVTIVGGVVQASLFSSVAGTVGELDGDGFLKDFFVRAIAVHPLDGALFVVVAPSLNAPFADHLLYEIDVDSGVVVADHTDALDGAVPWRIAFDDIGLLYVLDREAAQLVVHRPR